MPLDKPILLIDMDSVIVDLMTEWHRRYNADYMDNLTVERLTSWESERFVKPECGLKIYDYLDQPGLFAELPPMPGAVEALSQLHGDFELIIVTSSRTYAYTEKELWVEKHLPFIGKRNLIFAHRKELVRGDLLFDDAPHNLIEFVRTGRPAVAMDYPYNRTVDVPRAGSWEQFVQMVPDVLAARPARVNL